MNITCQLSPLASIIHQYLNSRSAWSPTQVVSRSQLVDEIGSRETPQSRDCQRILIYGVQTVAAMLNAMILVGVVVEADSNLYLNVATGDPQMPQATAYRRGRQRG